jgi:TetR/AcrR family transcriptional regulator
VALSHFLKLKPEKQEAILQAALDEFIEYGYDMASTNRIVERAGIAKGTLFKYFSSKEELFFYLNDKIADEIKPQVYIMDEEIPEGLFEALKLITMKKATIKYRFPREYALVLQMVKNTSHPVYRKLLEKYTEQSMQYYERLAQRVDTSNLRPGVTREEAFRLVGWTLRGMEEYILDQVKTTEYSEEYEKSLYAEFDRMCELLKYGLYNPQPQPQPQPAEFKPAVGKIVPAERVAVLQ